MPKTVGVAIPWDSVWIYSVAGLQDLETGTTVDIEETMVMEDPATTVQEPAIILTNLKEEVTSKEGSSRTRSSFTMAILCHNSAVEPESWQLSCFYNKHV